MGTRRRASSPPPPTAPAHTSVARSLAAAAAALRSSEWCSEPSAARENYVDENVESYYRGPLPVEATYGYGYRTEQQDAERHAFYEELRARHLTQRQRLAREFYAKEQQERENWTNSRPGGLRASRPVLAAVTQDVIPRGDGRSGVPFVENRADDNRLAQSGRSYNRKHPPTSPGDAAGRMYRAPPTKQLAVPTPDRIVSQHKQLESPKAAERLSLPRSPSATTKTTTPTTKSTMSPESEPAVVEDVDGENDDDGDGEAAVVEDDSSENQKKRKKRVRYLRDTDRRDIIKRIENGEKQAALAREFGVTRAAICHIKKNKFEILSRYNMLVKSAQEMDIAENFVGPPGVEMMVHQVRANSVLLLMTMLRDSRSTGATFRRVAGRLIMILLEEALAIVGTRSVDVTTGTGHMYRGLEIKHPFCGVGIGAEGFPFLVLFHQMEPEAPQGSIHVEMTRDARGNELWHIDHMDLPANIVQHKVLLFSSTCNTGEAECKAIEALCSVGCLENNIMLVVILAASDAIVKISDSYPQVKMVVGAIDDKVDPHTHSIVPGFGDFVSRYNGD